MKPLMFHETLVTDIWSRINGTLMAGLELVDLSLRASGDNHHTSISYRSKDNLTAVKLNARAAGPPAYVFGQDSPQQPPGPPQSASAVKAIAIAQVWMYVIAR